MINVIVVLAVAYGVIWVSLAFATAAQCFDATEDLQEHPPVVAFFWCFVAALIRHVSWPWPTDNVLWRWMLRRHGGEP